MREQPVFAGISQVGLVVRDCMASVKKYNDEYGIGPWAIYEMNPDSVQEMVIHGKPEKYAMRAAVANIGDTQIELIQPLDEKSIYADFLKTHGEGIHHLLFDVDSYDETVNFFQEKGLGIFQGGNFKGGIFTYFDTTRELGLVSEIYRPTPEAELPEPDDIYPKGA